mgnify:CR=1 FL=1
MALAMYADVAVKREHKVDESHEDIALGMGFGKENLVLKYSPLVDKEEIDRREMGTWVHNLVYPLLVVLSVAARSNP